MSTHRTRQDLLALVRDLDAADVTDRTLDSSSGGHGGGHEMGAATVALAALKVAVGGACAALARRELVRVHGEAHGAPWLTPLEA